MRLNNDYLNLNYVLCFFSLEFHSSIQNGLTYVVQELIKYVDLIHNERRDKCFAIKTAVNFGHSDLLKVLFKAYIKAYISSPEYDLRKLEHDETKIYSLNPILDIESNMSPLYVAASSGNIEMVKSFVEHIKYVDNINEKCNGLAPIEAAAKAGHFEIVNILMPLTTDLEFSTWSEISCTCIKLKQFIQDMIKQFIVQTKKTNHVLGNAQVIARSYLSKHNWNLKKAIAYDELNGEYWKLKSYVEKHGTHDEKVEFYKSWESGATENKHEALLRFMEETNSRFEQTVAITYLSQNNWNCERSIYALYNYRSNFHEWEKWAKKQENQEDAQVPIQNCNCCEIPKKNVRQEIPDIDFSEIVLDDSDDDEVEEVVEDEDENYSIH